MKQTITAVKLLRKEMISNPNIDRKLIDQLQSNYNNWCRTYSGNSEKYRRRCIKSIIQLQNLSNEKSVKKSLRDLQSMIDRSCYENKMEEIYADRNPSAWLASQVDLSFCMTKDDY